MTISCHWETFKHQQNEYGTITTFSLRDENVFNNQMLERIMSKHVLSTSWVKVSGIEDSRFPLLVPHSGNLWRNSTKSQRK